MPLDEDPQDEYTPYDPSTVRTDFQGPQRGDAADDSEPQPGADVSGEGSEDETPLLEFDPKFRDDFNGLAYLGAITKTFTWIGHKFTIRTLTTDELLAVALLVKDYENTIAASRAFVTATVAMSVVSVDGQGLPVPFQEEPGNGYAEYRFRYVAGQWYSYTIDKVYEHYLLLESRVQQTIEAMGKHSG